MYLLEKSLSWNSSLGRMHTFCLLPQRPSTVFSGFTGRRRLWAARLNTSRMPCLLAFSIVFLLGLACCFCSYLGNVPSSRLHISALCTKQELVHVDPSSVQLLLNAEELLMGICEEYVPSPRTFLAVSLYWVVRTPQ